MFERLNFYQDKVLINLLARDLENAKEVMRATDGHALVGVITKKYPNVEECVKTVKEYMAEIGNVSVGLGDGDPRQWDMVAQVSALTDPGHANQVFPGAMVNLGMLRANHCTHTVVNCLMSPTGVPGKVKISTGPYSALAPEAIVEVDTAMAFLKDSGLNSIKFYHLKGLTYAEDLKAVAKAAVKAGIPLVEPTGGLTPANVAEVVQICLDAGCERVMPHIYTSIIDKETGLTKADMALDALNQIKKLL